MRGVTKRQKLGNLRDHLRRNRTGQRSSVSLAISGIQKQFAVECLLLRAGEPEGTATPSNQYRVLIRCSWQILFLHANFLHSFRWFCKVNILQTLNILFTADPFARNDL